MRNILTILFIILAPIAGKAESLSDSIAISASGMRVQGNRLRVISQNIANADSTALTPGGDPYRRKTIFFTTKHNVKTKTELVVVRKYGLDDSPFELRYDPTHPAADEAGYVKLPNVNPLIEAQDAKEAQRSYEANLNMLDISRNMLGKTLDILR